MTSWRRKPWISGLSLLFVEEVLIPGTGIMLGSVPLLTNVVLCSYVIWLTSVALLLLRKLEIHLTIVIWLPQPPTRV